MDPTLEAHTQSVSSLEQGIGAAPYIPLVEILKQVWFLRLFRRSIKIFD
jgi:hypothetical protein